MAHTPIGGSADVNMVLKVVLSSVHSTVIERSRNYLRRKEILSSMERIYAS